MIRITHPRPELGRQSALGVEFRDGVATVPGLHPEREAALRLHGYTLAVIEEPVEPVGPAVTAEDLEAAAPLGENLPSKRSKGSRGRKSDDTENTAERTAEPVPDGGFGVLPDMDPSMYGPDAVELEE